jgi:hypothetical protein
MEGQQQEGRGKGKEEMGKAPEICNVGKGIRDRLQQAHHFGRAWKDVHGTCEKNF